MLPKVYLETTIPSFVTARTSQNLIRAGQQATTVKLFAEKREVYEWYTSQLVRKECGEGDAESARTRMEWLETIPLVVQSDETVRLAERLLTTLPFPSSAAADAFHIALACTGGMDVLLSWNCKHIANPRFAERIRKLAESAGFKSPVLCTPYELLGE